MQIQISGFMMGKMLAFRSRGDKFQLFGNNPNREGFYCITKIAKASQLTIYIL